MNRVTPPNYIERIIEWYCDPYLAEGIMGDLNERFELNMNHRGDRQEGASQR